MQSGSFGSVVKRFSSIEDVILRPRYKVCTAMGGMLTIGSNRGGTLRDGSGTTNDEGGYCR